LVINRGDGILDCRFTPIAANQYSVLGKSHDPVLMNGVFHGIGRQDARVAIYEMEYLRKHAAGYLLARPTRESFRSGVEIRHVTRLVDAYDSVTNGIKSNLRALALHKERVFDRCARHDVLQHQNERRLADMTLQHPILRSVLDRFPGNFLILPVSENQDRYAPSFHKDLVEGIDSLAVGKKEIEQNRVDAALKQPSDTSHQAASPEHAGLTVGCLSKRVKNRRAGSGIVADHQDVLGSYVHNYFDCSAARGRASVRQRTNDSARATRGTQTAAGSYPLSGHTDWVRSVAFSPDGKRIVSGSDDNSLRLWDAVKGVPLNEPLTGHTGRVTSVAFAPDGKHLVSGSFDKAVRLWDADKGIALGEPIVDATSRFVTVAFSPDGRHVASGGGDKIVTILAVLDAWADSLCEKLPPPRRMTDAEWNKWVGNIPYATSRQCAG